MAWSTPMVRLISTSPTVNVPASMSTACGRRRRARRMYRRSIKSARMHITPVLHRLGRSRAGVSDAGDRDAQSVLGPADDSGEQLVQCRTQGVAVRMGFDCVVGEDPDLDVFLMPADVDVEVQRRRDGAGQQAGSLDGD